MASSFTEMMEIIVKTLVFLVTLTLRKCGQSHCCVYEMIFILMDDRIETEVNENIRIHSLDIPRHLQGTARDTHTHTHTLLFTCTYTQTRRNINLTKLESQYGL